MTRPRGRRVVNLRILPSSMSVLAICAGLTSIRFGSRLDTYLPAGTELSVRLGQRAGGGETVLAELP